MPEKLRNFFSLDQNASVPDKNIMQAIHKRLLNLKRGGYDYLDMLAQAVKDAFSAVGSEMIERSLLAFKERLH